MEFIGPHETVEGAPLHVLVCLDPLGGPIDGP